MTTLEEVMSDEAILQMSAAMEAFVRNEYAAGALRSPERLKEFLDLKGIPGFPELDRPELYGVEELKPAEGLDSLNDIDTRRARAYTLATRCWDYGEASLTIGGEDWIARVARWDPATPWHPNGDDTVQGDGYKGPSIAERLAVYIKASGRVDDKTCRIFNAGFVPKLQVSDGDGDGGGDGDLPLQALAQERLHAILLQYPVLMHPRLRVRGAYGTGRIESEEFCSVPHAIAIEGARFWSVCESSIPVTAEFANHPCVILGLSTRAPSLDGDWSAAAEVAYLTCDPDWRTETGNTCAFTPLAAGWRTGSEPVGMMVSMWKLERLLTPWTRRSIHGFADLHDGSLIHAPGFDASELAEEYAAFVSVEVNPRDHPFVGPWLGELAHDRSMAKALLSSEVNEWDRQHFAISRSHLTEALERQCCNDIEIYTRAFERATGRWWTVPGYRFGYGSTTCTPGTEVRLQEIPELFDMLRDLGAGQALAVFIARHNALASERIDDTYENADEAARLEHAAAMFMSISFLPNWWESMQESNLWHGDDTPDDAGLRRVDGPNPDQVREGIRRLVNGLTRSGIRVDSQESARLILETLSRPHRVMWCLPHQALACVQQLAEYGATFSAAQLANFHTSARSDGAGRTWIEAHLLHDTRQETVGAVNKARRRRKLDKAGR